MTARQVYMLACDRCHNVLQNSDPTATGLRTIARRLGWTTGRGDGNDFCGNCRPGGVNPVLGNGQTVSSVGSTPKLGSGETVHLDKAQPANLTPHSALEDLQREGLTLEVKSLVEIVVLKNGNAIGKMALTDFRGNTQWVSVPPRGVESSQYPAKVARGIAAADLKEASQPVPAGTLLPSHIAALANRGIRLTETAPGRVIVSKDGLEIGTMAQRPPDGVWVSNLKGVNPNTNPSELAREMVRVTSFRKDEEPKGKGFLNRFKY